MGLREGLAKYFLALSLNRAVSEAFMSRRYTAESPLGTGHAISFLLAPSHFPSSFDKNLFFCVFDHSPSPCIYFPLSNRASPGIYIIDYQKTTTHNASTDASTGLFYSILFCAAV